MGDLGDGELVVAEQTIGLFHADVFEDLAEGGALLVEAAAERSARERERAGGLFEPRIGRASGAEELRHGDAKALGIGERLEQSLAPADGVLVGARIGEREAIFEKVRGEGKLIMLGAEAEFDARAIDPFG